ncbi:MAG: HAD-IA family hydrolase [Desulfobacterales bacterium]
MIKYLIFDFDGTIADTFQIVERSGLELAQKYGLHIDAAEAKRIGLKKALLKDKFPMWKVPRAMQDLKAAINQGIREEVQLFPGMKPVLEQLARSYSLGILSSNSKENIECFLNKNSVQELFSFIYSDSSLFGKEIVLKRLGKKQRLSLREMLYIGDEDRDIHAARKLKIPIIAVSWGYNIKDLLAAKKPDYLVEQPEELLRILTK